MPLAEAQASKPTIDAIITVVCGYTLAIGLSSGPGPPNSNSSSERKHDSEADSEETLNSPDLISFRRAVSLSRLVSESLLACLVACDLVIRSLTTSGYRSVMTAFDVSAVVRTTLCRRRTIQS